MQKLKRISIISFIAVALTACWGEGIRMGQRRVDLRSEPRRGCAALSGGVFPG